MLLTQISSPTAERQREKRRFLIVSFRLSLMLFGGIENIDCLLLLSCFPSCLIRREFFFIFSQVPNYITPKSKSHIANCF
jgi:hypothetical protein